MIWNEAAECMDEEDKKELQLSLLQQTVKRAYDNVPFYKKLLDDAGVKPEDIKTL
ncbi:MAG: phenylacetate--CoA ligase, partial [Methanobacteriaceae archaeon]|nr:phenylacetate--CoA ligase [Methanobacteriaceae archaeon]